MFQEFRRGLLRFFSSLQLTVVLLVLSMVLVFVGTLAQVNLGIWAVQDKYFRSFFILWNIPSTEIQLPVFPGGYILGGGLLINLLCAHITRFRLKWKKSGIIIAHAGIIVLLIGELISGLMQEDFRMDLQLHQTTNYSESFLRHELVISDTSDKDTNLVTAIPEGLLHPGASIQNPNLPFVVKVHDYYPNSMLAMKENAPNAPASPATAGIGPRLVAMQTPITYKPNEINQPTVFVELLGEDGSLGIWLASTVLSDPQSFTFAGKTWEMALRIERRYKPFSLTLTELRHDIYAGSDIPRNFSSRVRLQSQDGKEDREVLISMNNPLRYGGYALYQYQMNQASNNSVLQVVSNPGWLIPYISCVMMALGLAIHFILSLITFLNRRDSATTTA